MGEGWQWGGFLSGLAIAYISELGDLRGCGYTKQRFAQDSARGGWCILNSVGNVRFDVGISAGLLLCKKRRKKNDWEGKEGRKQLEWGSFRTPGGREQRQAGYFWEASTFSWKCCLKLLSLSLHDVAAWFWQSKQQGWRHFSRYSLLFLELVMGSSLPNNTRAGSNIATCALRRKQVCSETGEINFSVTLC